MSNQFTKQVCEVLDYQFNWSALLVDGDTIASYTLTASGITVDSDTLIDGDTKVQYIVSGGVADVDATVKCEVVTTNGLEDCATAFFTIVADDDKTTITVADLNLFYSASANLANEFVQCYIDIVSEADACLVGAGVSDCMIRMLKLNAAAYLMYSTSQYDGVKQMRSPTGESVTFSDTQGGTGLNSNQYGRYILMMDKNRCLVNLLESPDNERFIVAVGASNYVSSS